jgi:dissimilatory sulfite reductase (desulfoviridin) alpha/beta subunit
MGPFSSGSFGHQSALSADNTKDVGDAADAATCRNEGTDGTTCHDQTPPKKHRCCAMMCGGTVSMPSSKQGGTTAPFRSNCDELVAIVNAILYRGGPSIILKAACFADV